LLTNILATSPADSLLSESESESAVADATGALVALAAGAPVHTRYNQITSHSGPMLSAFMTQYIV